MTHAMPPPPSPATDGPVADLRKRRSLWAILQESLRQYGRSFLPLTAAVLPSVLMKGAGTVYCLLAPFWLVDTQRDWLSRQALPLQLALLIGVVLPGVFLFCRGVWVYLVTLASLNRNVIEILRGEKPRFREAFEAIPPKLYTRLLSLVLLLLWLPPYVAWGLGILGFNLLPDPGLRLVAYYGGFFLSLLLTGGALIAYLYCALSFQVIALETPDPGPALSIVRRSIHLVRGNFWRTSILMTLLTLITGVLAPLITCLLLDLTQVSGLLSPPARFFVDQILRALSPDRFLTHQGFLSDLYGLLHGELIRQADTLARGLVDLLAATGVTLALLPLGTIAFTLLYLDLSARKPDC